MKLENHDSWVDPIVGEVRAAKERLAAQFDFSVEAILRDAKRREGMGGHRVVTHERRLPQNV